MGTLQLDVWRQTCIMGALKKILVIFLLNTAMVFALPKDLERQRKAIGIFNVIKFPNDPCIGSGTMNGTCYTADECSTRDGIASGSCADGYGVCCTITLSCGDTTTENCTYLMQASATSPNQDPPGSGVCEYTICPTTSSISRIRLDFATFDIAGPEPIAAGGFAANANTQDTNLAVGDCLTDVFTVSGAPQICGPNTGQHIILDTDGTKCINAIFTFSGAGTTRQYNIHVTQYDRSNSVNLAGQAGCLQYHTGNEGIVNSFNWQGVGDENGPVSTHLSNQDYKVCIRQTAGYCYICWAPIGTGVVNSIVGTFGLSNGASAAAVPKSGVGVNCPTAAMFAAGKDSNDYVIIQGGVGATAATVAALTANTVFTSNARFCGRYFNAGAAGVVGDATICSRQRPFMLGVHTDSFEAAQDMGADGAKADVSEFGDGGAAGTGAGAAAAKYGMAPLGTIGFSLGYQLVAC